MKIKAFCFFYNEEFLIPFFLSHYAWVDQIEALVSPSTDRTLHLLHQAPNVVVNPVEFPEGKFDDQFKIKVLNEVINESPFDADWHLVVDADEFVWPQGEPQACRYEIADYLRKEKSDVIVAHMWPVFRHFSDSDLDPTKPPLFQRRHGIADLDAIENKNGNKPVFTRPGLGLKYTVGQHGLEGNNMSVSPWPWEGAHWTNADPKFCVERRVKNRSPRMSPDNHAARLGFHNFELTPEKVGEECARHLNDPLCF